MLSNLQLEIAKFELPKLANEPNSARISSIEFVAG